ncbi:MAG: HAD family hydrolase [Clostridia bacterium]|nr:HAD family hydrolase [Clostridia bacterium]
MYKAIIFDLYGTLLDIHTDESQEYLWEKMALLFKMRGADFDPSELKLAYIEQVNQLLEKKRKKGVEHPDIDILKVFKNLFKMKNIESSRSIALEMARFFRVISLDYIYPYPGVIELLEYLKEEKYKLYLLSNAQESFAFDELDFTGIAKYFKSIYISSGYKIAKPDEDFFKILLDQEHLSENECLFIGNDHTTDIEGANRIGMDSLYVHTNCSQRVVPEEIGAKWRIDSGDLFEVLEVIKSFER